jgi:small subunit ribosomal protein S20
MANHKSSIKRIRQTNAKRLHNRYYAKTMRTAVKKFRSLTDKAEAEAKLPAGNLKSKITKYSATLS